MNTKHSVLAIAIGVMLALIALPLVRKAKVLGTKGL